MTKFLFQWPLDCFISLSLAVAFSLVDTNQKSWILRRHLDYTRDNYDVVACCGTDFLRLDHTNLVQLACYVTQLTFHKYSADTPVARYRHKQHFGKSDIHLPTFFSSRLTDCLNLLNKSVTGMSFCKVNNVYTNCSGPGKESLRRQHRYV